MVQRYRRGKKKSATDRPLLGNHQKCWIWGRNAVRETLDAGRWPILEIFLSTDVPDDQLDVARESARALGMTLQVESTEELTARCRSAEHQGYLARMTEYPYDDVQTVLANGSAQPLYAILDSIQDPYNFGAILRSAETLGVDGVFIGSQNQVNVTSLVARSSAGAVNHMAIAQVECLAELADMLKQLGSCVVAAHEAGSKPVYECDFTSGCAIVIGNEGRGISDDVLAVCDQQVAVPQYGRVGSLNAAVAAGILFYEAARQRGLSGERRPS